MAVPLSGSFALRRKILLKVANVFLSGFRVLGF